MTKLTIEKHKEGIYRLEGLITGDMFTLSDSMYIKLAAKKDNGVCTCISLTTGAECNFIGAASVIYHPKVKLVIEE
jgi:hypothetical protein